MVQSQPQGNIPYLENNQHKKRASGVTQVVECLSSKCEALSSNSSIDGRKEGRKERKKKGKRNFWIAESVKNTLVCWSFCYCLR
jgi:hypothetical protein